MFRIWLLPIALWALILCASSSGAAELTWKADWDRTVAAANKEGVLAIAGPSGRGWRDFLTQRFAKDYPQITIKLTPLAGRDFWPRLIKERDVGEYLWDLRVGGSDDNTHVLRVQGMFSTTRDLLVLPDVVDDTKWYGGLDGLFVDNAHQTLIAFALYESANANYNKRVIHIPITVKDVVDPRWTGKISMADPRGGATLNTASVLLKVYGEDYLRKLMVVQKPVITKDPRQQVEWLASGRYPITFGLPTASLVEYAASGANTADFVRMEGAPTWTQGVGGMTLISKAPHPNAAKVFINWMLTRQVQADLMQAVRLNSRRNDVPLGDPTSAVDTSKLSEYVGSQHEEMDYYHKKAAALLREIVR